MDLTRGWQIIDGVNGKMAVYTSRPTAALKPLPAVLVLQEVWGVDDHIVDVADRMASAGYLAISPDIYSIGTGERPDAISAKTGRIEAVKAWMDTMPPGAWQNPEARDESLAKLPPEEAAAIQETMNVLFGQFANMETFVAELVALVGWVGAHEFCSSNRVGAIGFCMGGGMASRLACEAPGLRGAIGFYGQAPTAEQLANLHCPLLVLHGEEDERLVKQIPDAQVAADAAGKDFEAIVYPNAPHAFFNDTRSSYRPDQSRAAWARTLAFLNAHVAV